MLSTINSTALFPYEIYCCCFSNIQKAPYDISLVFDATKKLRQARIHYKRTQSYVRDPDADMDCLFDLSSAVTHEPGTSTFNELIRSIFVSDQATNLLSEADSDIFCDFNLIKSNVKLIRLKIVTGEYQRKDADEVNIQFIYRTVKNVSLQNQQQRSTNTKETIEFCASPIVKRKSLLRLVCQIGLALTNNRQPQHHSALMVPMSFDTERVAENTKTLVMEYVPKIGEMSQLTLIPSKTVEPLTKKLSKSFDQLSIIIMAVILSF